MLTIYVNESKVRVPLGWHEVSTELYQKIKAIEEPNIIKLFSAVIGLDEAVISESRREELELAMFQVASFAFTEEDFRNDPIPSVWKISDKEIRIPQKLEALTIEQNLLLRQRLTQTKFIEQCISYATAVYLQPLVDGGKFNAERVPELEAIILSMPIEKTFPVGFFLLRRLQNFGKSGQMRWLLTRIWLTNLRKRFQKWLK
jgi:hypothetical protein